MTTRTLLCQIHRYSIAFLAAPYDFRHQKTDRPTRHVTATDDGVLLCCGNVFTSTY